MIKFIKQILSEDVAGQAARVSFFLLFSLMPGSTGASLPLRLWTMYRALSLIMDGIHRAVNGRKLKFTPRRHITAMMLTAAFMLAAEIKLTSDNTIGSAVGIFAFLTAVYCATPEVPRKRVPCAAAAVTLCWVLANTAIEYAGIFVNPALITAAWVYMVSFSVLAGAELIAMRSVQLTINN